MNCLYCDEEIKKIRFAALLNGEDKLCIKCREGMIKRHEKFLVEDMEVETFYDYDSFFRSLLLQYKECYDEALKDVFLYEIKDYLKFRYRGYRILYVPSTKRKNEERGFEHLRGIFSDLGMEEVKGLAMKNELVQEGRNRKEREEMTINYIYNGNMIDKVLIVDDVFTTGSSLKGVYSAIKPFTKRVKAVCLSKKTLA